MPLFHPAGYPTLPPIYTNSNSNSTAQPPPTAQTVTPLTGDSEPRSPLRHRHTRVQTLHSGAAAGVREGEGGGAAGALPLKAPVASENYRTASSYF